MDAVKAFNNELSSLYEVKPPISKAKMTAITRGAIKAIKFYKHVVQSVEKFILKCKPEYKVPGLYVIDSIVRQSRHQFGTDKDVFAPRFAKNMRQTFINLFQCPTEDKSKIIRVLNLWQKNQVFAPEVIQPLFDIADPNNPMHKELAASTPVQQTNGVNAAAQLVKGSPALQKTPTKGSQHGIEGAHLGGTNLNLSDPSLLLQLQRLLTSRAADAFKPESQVHFDKKLLDFDYGDDEDEAHSSPKFPTQTQSANDSVSSLLANPEVLRQLQTIQQTMAAGQPELDIDKLRKLQEMKQQEEEFDKHLAQTVPNLPFASECEFKPISNSSMMPGNYYIPSDLSQPPPGYDMPQSGQDNDVQYVSNDLNNGPDIEVITLDHGDSRSPSLHHGGDDRYRRRRSRSRERSRERRSDRDRRSRRSRSRSKTRRYRSRTRSRERNRAKEKETEKERERKKRGLPSIKQENLSVCSTTLWVGHLSKLVHQEDLSNTFGEYGDIVSIDLIPPRGCAFIVMHRRQDAARCLVKLKNHVLHSKPMTLAWAPGKGVKGKDLKDYWEGDLGVSYIPWHKLKPDMDLELLEDGGMIDEDTMPDWMRARIHTLNSQSQNMIGQIDPNYVQSSIDTSQPPPSGILQPPPHMPISLVPPFQFNNRLLGMNMLPPPMGVPPPNLPTSLIQPPALVAQFQQPMPSERKEETPSLSETLLSMASQPFMAPPQPPLEMLRDPDDNMDIEMEDAAMTEKPERLPLLSEQLQAQMGELQREQFNDGDDRRERRGRRNSHGRDAGNPYRERERDRGGNNVPPPLFSDPLKNRGDENRRDRPNRWGDRDAEVDERREREKTLNDRLQQMAMAGTSDLPPPPFPPGVDRNGGGNDLPSFPEQPQDFPDCPPNFPDCPPNFPDCPPNFPDQDPNFSEGPSSFNEEAPDFIEGPANFDEGPPMFPDGPPMFGDDENPMFNDFHNPMMDEDFHPPPLMDGNDFGFEGPPRMRDFDPPPPERFMRGGRRDFRDKFEPRGRGPQDFFQPRDGGFGPRGMMRGPPDFPPVRGMMRGPGPQRFRGPPMRGPRPNQPWKDRPNFGGPRFEHRGPPSMFDDGPPHPRHRGGPPRFEDRRRPPRGPPGHFGHENPPMHPELMEGRAEKRTTRWGTFSPDHDEMPQEEAVETESNEPKGGNTPLRDEPFNNRETQEEKSENIAESEAPTTVKASDEESTTKNVEPTEDV